MSTPTMYVAQQRRKTLARLCDVLCDVAPAVWRRIVYVHYDSLRYSIGVRTPGTGNWQEYTLNGLDDASIALFLLQVN